MTPRMKKALVYSFPPVAVPLLGAMWAAGAIGWLGMVAFIGRKESPAKKAARAPVEWAGRVANDWGMGWLELLGEAREGD